MAKRKNKSGIKQQDDAAFLLESPVPQSRGIGEYMLPGLLFLIFIIGGFTMGCLILQQQSTIDQLTESYSAMQMRITKFQQGMGMNDAQVSPGERVEERLQALEEAQRQAQRRAEDTLVTSEMLNTSDLSSQVWAIHADMDNKLSQLQKTAVSAATLQSAIKNKSEEFEAVKVTVASLLSSSSAVAVSVGGLSSRAEEMGSQVEAQGGLLDSLVSRMDEQVRELGELSVSLGLHKAALEANSQQVGEIRELLVAEQNRRAQVLEQQLQSVVLTLDEQLQSSQSLHSSLRAQLQAVHNQITNGGQAREAPDIKPVTEEISPVSEEEQGAVSQGQEETQEEAQEEEEEEEEEEESVSQGEKQQQEEQEEESVSQGEEEEEVTEEEEEPAELQAETEEEEILEEEESVDQEVDQEVTGQQEPEPSSEEVEEEALKEEVLDEEQEASEEMEEQDLEKEVSEEEDKAVEEEEEVMEEEEDFVSDKASEEEEEEEEDIEPPEDELTDEEDDFSEFDEEFA